MKVYVCTAYLLHSLPLKNVWIASWVPVRWVVMVYTEHQHSHAHPHHFRRSCFCLLYVVLHKNLMLWSSRRSVSRVIGMPIGPAIDFLETCPTCSHNWTTDCVCWRSLIFQGKLNGHVWFSEGFQLFQRFRCNAYFTGIAFILIRMHVNSHVTTLLNWDVHARSLSVLSVHVFWLCRVYL